MGYALQKKLVDEKNEGFSLRVRIGEYEVELSGTHQEVMKTVQSLPELIANINKAFDAAKPKTIATITVKTAEATTTTNSKSSESPSQNYPKIGAIEDADGAILKILDSDWGKWRPRRLEEINDALQANDLNYVEPVLSKTLDSLAEKGLVRRWNTNTGFVYILAEQKNLHPGEN
jgi:hypothetical protein